MWYARKKFLRAKEKNSFYIKRRERAYFCRTREESEQQLANHQEPLQGIRNLSLCKNRI